MSKSDTNSSPPFFAKQSLKVIFGIAVSIFCLYLLIQRVEVDETVEKLARINPRYLALGLAALASGYALRIYRWSTMLRAYNPAVKTGSCVAPYLGSIALNNILPLRAGDLVRAFVFPNSLGIKKSHSTITLVIERVLDMVVLLLFLAYGLMNVNLNKMPQQMMTGGILLSIAVLFLLVSLFALPHVASIAAKMKRSGKNGLVEKILDSIVAISDGLSALMRPAVLWKLLVMTVSLWVLEAGLYLSILFGLGLGNADVNALLLSSVGTLSTLIPSSPGYIGTFHFVVYSFLKVLGIENTDAACFSFVSHLLLWLPTSLAGILLIALNHKMFSLKAPKEQR